MPTSGVQYKLDPTPEPSDEEEESEEEEDDGFGSSKKKGEELDPAASKFQILCPWLGNKVDSGIRLWSSILLLVSSFCLL